MSEQPRPFVLVIDDDKDSLQVLTRLLSMNGYSAHGVSTCADARAFCAANRCAVIVSDILLKDGSGLQLIPELKTGDMRAIAMSGDPAFDDQKATRAAGFDAYLRKPVSPSMLLNQISAFNLPGLQHDL